MNNSLIYQCGICLNAKPKRLLDLYGQEKCLAVKFRKFYSKTIPLHFIPSKSCETCFKNLYKFKSLVQKLLHYNKIYKKLNGTMQKNHPNPENNGNELPKTLENTKHEFNCECEDCRSKHGDLPLLIEVMERGEVGRVGRNAETEKFESQPSTSQQPTPMAGKSNKKQLLCVHCGKLFTHKGDFNKHLRKHTGDQPFSCPTCHRKFAHTSNLHRHLRIHSGNRPFVCKSCDKSFSRKDKLDSHRKSKFCRKNADN